MPTPNCIICMQDEDYIVVGPFASRDALRAWGERWQRDHDDDPRWQSIYLADPSARPIRVIPTQETEPVPTSAVHAVEDHAQTPAPPTDRETYLTEVLRLAATQFERYQQHHLGKTHPETGKAQMNGEWAARCREAAGVVR